LVFLDESGFLLVPNLQRTWSRKGRTPVIVVAGRWTKISAISAISVSPKRNRLGLYTRFYLKKDIHARQVAKFIRQIGRHLRGPIGLLWDRSPLHKAKIIRQSLQKLSRIHPFYFPGYAPELNPDEFVWANLKRAIANSVPQDLIHLRHLLKSPLKRLRRSQKLLWSCIHASDLPWIS
jgi:transposase